MHSEVCLLLHELQISSDTIRRDDLDILAQSLPMTCAVAVIVLPYCVLEEEEVNFVNQLTLFKGGNSMVQEILDQALCDAVHLSTSDIICGPFNEQDQ